MREPAERELRDLNRKQLEVYAKELGEALKKERELRSELEEANRQLENRIRELTALNDLFQKHLRQRFETIEAYEELVERLEGLAREMSNLLDFARSRPIPRKSSPDRLLGS